MNERVNWVVAVIIHTPRGNMLLLGIEPRQLGTSTRVATPVGNNKSRFFLEVMYVDVVAPSTHISESYSYGMKGGLKLRT